MNVGFYYHVPGAFKGSGRVLVPAFVGRFLDGLSHEVGSITSFFHELPDDELSTHELDPQGVSAVSLGPPRSAPARTFFPQKDLATICQYLDSLDCFIVRGPSPLLPAIANRVRPLPTVLLLVGEYLPGVEDLPQPRWRKELIRAWCLFNTIQQDRVARGCTVVANSERLAERFRRRARAVHLVRTTTFSNTDLFRRPDTCQGTVVRLLYTGRLDSQKGIGDIIAAMGLLRDRGLLTALDIAGWEDSCDPILTRALSLADSLGLGDAVTFLGFKAAGNELFDLYRKADVFVTASRASEGFPRTIWEAMSQSLPVVATRVGSIPLALKDGRDAVLAEARSPSSLADGIEKVIKNNELRRSLLREGLRLATLGTIEETSRALATVLRDLVRAEEGRRWES